MGTCVASSLGWWNRVPRRTFEYCLGSSEQHLTAITLYEQTVQRQLRDEAVLFQYSGQPAATRSCILKTKEVLSHRIGAIRSDNYQPVHLDQRLNIMDPP